MRLYGFPERDAAGVHKGVADDLFVRAAYFTHDDEEVLLLSCDLLFFNRAQNDRYTAAVGRALDLKPRQVLLNTSHTHAGPMLDMGSWGFATYLEPEHLYQEQLEKAIIEAAVQAKRMSRAVTLWAGETRSTLPVSRRLIGDDGKLRWAPNPNGTVYDKAPVCLARDDDGEPVVLLFSISCHPSTIYSEEISSDYPGVAHRILDEHLGRPSSMFLLGAAGDAKPLVIAGDQAWKSGTRQDVEKAGRIVAQEVIEVLESGLRQIEPDIATYMTEMSFGLKSPPDRTTLTRIAQDENEPELKRLWAQRQSRSLTGSGRLADSLGVSCHGVRLGRNLRLVGLEAEIVGELGWLIDKFYDGGITFPLGFTGGVKSYLPTSRMIDQEGGYEVESYWEYGLPAGLQTGVEETLTAGLRELAEHGI